METLLDRKIPKIETGGRAYLVGPCVLGVHNGEFGPRAIQEVYA